MKKIFLFSVCLFLNACIHMPERQVEPQNTSVIFTSPNAPGTYSVYPQSTQPMYSPYFETQNVVSAVEYINVPPTVYVAAPQPTYTEQPLYVEGVITEHQPSGYVFIPQTEPLPSPEQAVLAQEWPQTSELDLTVQVESLEAPVTPEPPTPPQEAVTVVLQHPVNRDLIQCSSDDKSCLVKGEQKGYVRLSNIPRFAGHKDTETSSDYPKEKWRDNNNIPRW